MRKPTSWVDELTNSAAAMETADVNTEEYKQAESIYMVAFNLLLSRGYKPRDLLKKSGIPLPPALTRKG